MKTGEDMVLEAARAAGWSVKRLRPSTLGSPYRAFQLTRGRGQGVIVQFDKVDGGMVDAFTTGRDFDGRLDVINYLQDRS